MGRRKGERSDRSQWLPKFAGDHDRRSGADKPDDSSPAQPLNREKIRFDDADTAFILGRGGKTKHKIARVSGAKLELHERSNVVEICGSEDECRKARKYIMLVQAQRVGPVHVDATHDDGDLTVIDVPSSCVGFVTGTQGNFLRACEEEWGTLMFFCDYRGPNIDGKAVERLAIFGLPVGRSGAELKVMAAIETKLPGYFTNGLGDTTCSEEWGMDTLPLSSEDLSFALGKEGATRKKLARSSGCILEYVGQVAYMVGERAERQRARDYITWLLQQRTGPVFIDISKRTDATGVDVPTELTGILKGSTLRDVEYETDTFCFLEGDVDSSNRLLIFGSHRGRKQAERKVRDLIRVRPRQPASDNGADRYNKSETIVKAEVRISPVVAAAIELERLLAIQHSTGTKVTQNGTESVSVQGYEQQVAQAKKHLHEYIYNLKVEEEFVVPKDVPFHVFIAKGGDGKSSVLETVRNHTRVRVKVIQADKKILLAGVFSVVANAKRDLQSFLGSFVTQHIHLEKPQLEKVSVLGREQFPKLQDFRHLCAAQINKELCCLTLSGAPEAVAEAHGCVEAFFRQQGWSQPRSELYAWKHNMKAQTRGEHLGERELGPSSTRRAAELMQLTNDDSAFILGRGGKTKHKIAKVSGAQLELHEHNNTIEIIGAELERRRARKYIELVRAQRMGPVNVDETHDDSDLTMISVPHHCVGFVTGAQGNFLRTCEEEWATLMFFCDYQGPGGEGGGVEKLAIFGNKAGRTGAELKVMAAIETKIPGFFTKDCTDNVSPDDWGRDSLNLGNEELSFALGKDGSTRKKLARASGCILEYVGNTAFMAGTSGARRRARDYLGWLMKQRTGTVYVDIEGRTDVCAVDIPDGLDAVASVFKSMTLRSLEQETGTFCFLEGNASKSDRLLIFSQDRNGREKAKAIALERIDQRMKTPGHHQRSESRHWEEHHKSEHSSHMDQSRTESAEVSDTFTLRGDISVHVVIQTGPDGQDPVVEDVEHTTGTKLTLVRDKGVIQIHGAPEKVAQAKRQLQQFIDRFVTCRIQLPPPITAALANKVSHYIRPMPWIAAAEVDEAKDLLKIQGHQDSVDQTFKVLREVYRDHGLELLESDIVTSKKGADEHSYSMRYISKGKGADVLRVSEDDAAFILGRGGKTKHKIARVSGATLELHERNNTVEIFGGDPERRKARKYVELVRAQRVGPVNVDEAHDDGDLTMIAVPHNCVGFVTGSQGNFLRTCEEEWGTLMFFCDYQGPSTDGMGGAERLAIFGDLKGRCGAELKVMAAIETKLPGYYTTNLGDTHSWDEWGTDTVPLEQDQLSYALGKKGSTRKKLAKASGCILEYVGSVAFLAGSLAARQRCREYLGWLCDQVCNKTGRISIDPTTRDDVTLVPVPKDCIGYVMGDKRKTLSRLEEDWETLIFFVDSQSLPTYQDVEGLAIFGAERGRAGTELKVMGAVETKLPQFFTKGVGDFHYPHEWGVDTLPLGNEDLSFALGKDGSTRRKLARASGCILEYVGNVAYMAGTVPERRRARDYLTWLMRQRLGPVTVDFAGRDDMLVVDIPDQMRGMTKASALRDVEKETGTFCFFQGDNSTSNALLVCGHQQEDRAHAQHILQDLLVRGASRPKPRRRVDGPIPANVRRTGSDDSDHAPERPKPRLRVNYDGAPGPSARDEQSSDESDSGSHTGSESDRSSQSDDDARSPAAAPQTRVGGFIPRGRQWASEDSGSGSDEEIVPYWRGGGTKF